MCITCHYFKYIYIYILLYIMYVGHYCVFTSSPSKAPWWMLKSNLSSNSFSNSFSISSALCKQKPGMIHNNKYKQEQEAKKALRILAITEHHFAFPSNEMNQLEWQILYKHLCLNLHSLIFWLCFSGNHLIFIIVCFLIYKRRAWPWTSLQCPPALT